MRQTLDRQEPVVNGTSEVLVVVHFRNLIPQTIGPI